MSTMKLQKGMESTGCLLDSGISKVPCVLSLVRVPTFANKSCPAPSESVSCRVTENAGAFRQGSLLLAKCVECFP